MRSEKVTWRSHPSCKRPHGMWRAEDDQATEVEVTNFIRALVYLTKPKVIVETGTYAGQTTVELFAAVQDNRDTEAWITTYEIDPEVAASASARFKDLGQVTVVPGAISYESCPKAIDLAFLDSGMKSRGADMAIVWKNLARGGLVVVHDASPLRPPGQVRPPRPYQMLDIATPRGLLIFQKPW